MKMRKTVMSVSSAKKTLKTHLYSDTINSLDPTRLKAVLA